MSGGGANTESRTAFPKWLKPEMQYGIAEARNLYNTMGPPPSLYAGMDPQRQRFLTGQAQSEIADPSVLEYGRTMRGEYLSGSPYLDEVIRRAQGDAQSNVGSQYGGSGRFGGGQWAASLADATTGVSAAYRDANWQAERDRMGSYLGMAPQVLATGEYAGRSLEEDVGLQQEEAYRQYQAPYDRLNQLLGAIYGSPAAQRPGQSSSSSKDLNWVDIVGGILGGVMK